MPKVNNSLVGCGIKNRMDAITTEAKAYFAMFFHGIFSLTILRIMTYRTRNIAERAIVSIIPTYNAAVTGGFCAKVVKT